MRPTPANIAYLCEILKGFTNNSQHTWYNRSFMENLNGRSNKEEKTENLSLGALVRRIRLGALVGHASEHSGA